MESFVFKSDKFDKICLIFLERVNQSSITIIKMKIVLIKIIKIDNIRYISNFKNTEAKILNLPSLPFNQTCL